MSRFPDLYLLRHGETEWNAADRLQGQLDSPLTEKGRAQAAQQAQLLAALSLGPSVSRFASHLGRAQATAEIVYGGQPFETDDRLSEIDIGTFSGMRLNDLAVEFPGVFRNDGLGWYDRAPGGEGLSGLHARVRDFLNQLQGPAVLVTHGITLRMIRAVVHGWSMDRLDEGEVVQGAIHYLGEAGERTIGA